MNRQLLVLITVLLFAAVSAACSSTAAAPAQPTADLAQAPTAVPAKPTLALVEPTATAAPAKPAASPSVLFKGISFSYSKAMAKDVEPSVQQAVDGGADAPYWMSHPEFVQFKFSGYILGKTFHEPRIEIYPVADYLKVNAQAGKTIDALHSYLKTSRAGDQGMPFLPIFNAAQVAHAQVKGLDFQNGTGVRYITQFDQYPAPLNNFELFYTYQGLTEDGKYYVSAILPVSSSLLPADDKTRPQGDYKQYLSDTTAKLDAASGSSFSPDLGTLDALIASLKVQPK